MNKMKDLTQNKVNEYTHDLAINDLADELNIKTIESLAYKGHLEPSDLRKCEENQIVCYISKYVSLFLTFIYFVLTLLKNTDD